MTLYRRVPRQVARHRFRYLSLTLLIALGSLALVTLNIIMNTLQYSFDRVGVEGQVEDVRAWLATEPANLESLGQHYHFDIESRTSVDLQLNSEAELRVFDRSERVDRPVVLRGRDLESEHEIMLNAAFAATQDLKIGGRVTLLGTDFQICGYFTLPDYIYPTRHESDLMSDPDRFGIGIISKPAMVDLLHAVALTDEDIAVDRSYGIRYLTGHGDIKDLLKSHGDLIRWLELKDNARVNMVKGEIAGISEIATAIPLAFFLINCALLASILWRMIRLEFRQIGILRALGLSPAEILRHYLVLPLSMAIVGSTLGTVGGMTLAKPVLALYAAFFNLPVDRLQVDQRLLLASILVPTGLLLVTAVAVILRAVNLPPLALIRGFRQKVKAMKLEKLIHLGQLRFETKYRIRQSVRSIGKLFAALIGVSFAAMFTLAGFLVQGSYSFLLNEGIRGTFRYDQNYVFKVMQSDNDYGGEPYQIKSVQETRTHEAMAILGLSDNQKLLHLVDQQGQVLQIRSSPDTLPRNTTGSTSGGATSNSSGDMVRSGIISRVLADRLHLSVGNTLSFADPIENKIYFIRVGAIAENYTQLAIYLPINDFNQLFELKEGSFKGVFSDRPLPVDSEDLYLNEKMEDVISSFESYTVMIKAMLLGMGVVSSLMALLILYILIALLIEENSRSIALLKILGYEAGEIRRLILRTFNLPVLAGFALGIPLLLRLYGGMIEDSFAEIDMTLPLILSPEYIAVAFALLYSTYLLTRSATGRKIYRISMADGLKNMAE